METEAILNSKLNLSHPVKLLRARYHVKPRLKRSQVRCRLSIDSSIFSQISNRTGRVSTVSIPEDQVLVTSSIARGCSQLLRLPSKRKKDSANLVKLCAS